MLNEAERRFSNKLKDYTESLERKLAERDTHLDQLHKENREAIRNMETTIYGKKDDPQDNGLKGDVSSINKTLKIGLKLGVALAALAFASKGPELVKSIFEFLTH